MSAEENKAIIRRLVEEVYNGGNLDVLDEIMAPDVFNHTTVPQHQRGIEGFKHVARWGYNLFPDGRYEIEDMMAEGDKVACRVTVSGTHQGELWNISPTGKRFSVEHIHWHRLAGGKLVERWAVRDDLGDDAAARRNLHAGIAGGRHPHITAPGSAKGKEEPVSTEENKVVFRRYIEEVGSKGNLDLVDEVFASRFIDHQIDGNTKERDAEWSKQFLRRLREAFPDAHYEIEYQVAEGDKVATRWTMRATHRGEFRGIIPPTGKEIMVTGIGIFRFSEEGKVVETWDNFDQLGMMRQIGVVPLPGPSLLARIFVHHAKKLLFTAIPVSTDPCVSLQI